MSHVDLAAAYCWLVLMVVISKCWCTVGISLERFSDFARQKRSWPQQFFMPPMSQAYGMLLKNSTGLTGAMEYNLSFATILLLVSLLYE